MLSQLRHTFDSTAGRLLGQGDIYCFEVIHLGIDDVCLGRTSEENPGVYVNYHDNVICCGCHLLLFLT